MKGILLAAALALTTLAAPCYLEPAAQESNAPEYIVANAAAPVLPSAEPTPAEPPLWQDCNVPEYTFTQAAVDALARLVYGEARNCDIEGQAAVVWCVLNRMDDERFPDTIMDVITQQSQFFGYKESYPILPELVEVVEDVLMRYSVERSSGESAGRVLPREYVYFSGDGTANYFTTAYASMDVWDWSLRSPYRE